MRKLISSILVTALFSQAALSPLALANSHSAFNPTEVEETIVAFYGFYNGNKDGLDDTDKDELADGLADEVSTQAPGRFNDVIGHLVIDYRQNPEHRAPIEELIRRCHDKVDAELRSYSEQHPVMELVTDVFGVLTIAYAFGFGRGLWETRGDGLTGLAKFRASTFEAWSKLSKARKILLGAAAITSAYEAYRAISELVETHRLDPSIRLADVQRETLRDIGTEVASLRDELRGLTAQTAALDRLKQISARADTLDEQFGHLEAAAPQLHGPGETVTEDLATIRSLLPTLGLKPATGPTVSGGAPN